MCKLIADLAGTDRRIVKELIHRLETRSHNPGVDVRLTGEIYGSAHMKARALGLDPHDTTPKELYQALLGMVRLHDTFLTQRFGLKHSDSNTKKIQKISNILSRLNTPKNAWVLRSTTIRDLLQKNPPKTLQRLLNYKSVSSMLKREQPGVLLAAARYTEPISWQNKMQSRYKKITPMDFQADKTKIYFLGSKKWQNATDTIVKKAHANIITSYEAGTVITMPVPGVVREGMALLTFAVGLHAYNEIRMYGSFLKFHQMQPDFGQLLVKVLHRNKGQHIKLVGQDVHWRSVHRHFGKDSTPHPHVFQPHVQAEDIAYRRAESVLYRLEPALEFWHNMDYVGWPQSSGPVSFNLIDNTINLVNNVPFEKRVSLHLRESVWDELYARYLTQNSLVEQLFNQLDSRVVTEPVLADLEFVL